MKNQCPDKACWDKNKTRQQQNHPKPLQIPLGLFGGDRPPKACLGMWFTYWVWLDWWKLILLCQLEKVSWLGMGDHVQTPFSMLALYLAGSIHSCMMSPFVCVHRCLGPVVSRRHCFLGAFPLWILRSLHILFPKGFLSCEGRGLTETFRIGSSKVSYSLHIAQFWEFLPIYCREKLDGWARLQSMVIADVSRSHFIVMFF